MKEFRSTFVGIPLPDEYLGEFAGLLDNIKAINPDVKTVHPATPHITMYYLAKQPETNLNAIELSILKYTPLLNDCDLTIGGIDTFGKPVPKVLFLPVDHPKSLIDFAMNLSQDLKQFDTSDNNLAFHPHMTVGRLYHTSKEVWESTHPAMQEAMEKVAWQFPVKEVVIYGAEITERQSHYKKLISVSIL